MQYTQMGDGELALTLLPYVRRANELQNYEPLVSYYCRLYAKNRLLKIPQNDRTEAINMMLSSLMERLEKDTKSVQLSSNDRFYIENFAMNMFMKADKQERRGKADLRTAKTFYAASLFFEILQNFNYVRFDIEQKQKYAAWRAAEIRKALKKKGQRALKGGSQPSPRLPASDKASLLLNDALTSPVSQLDKSVADPSEVRLPVEESFAVNDAREDDLSPAIAVCSANPSPILVPTMSISSNKLDKQDESDDDESFYDCSDVLSSSDSEHEVEQSNNLPFEEVENGAYHPSTAEIFKAHKAAKLAVSALAFEDVPSAISYLEQALALLTVQESNK